MAYTGLYNADGQRQVTIVSGSSYTGLMSADGQYNGVLNDGVSTLVGLYHPCGAYNVTVASSINMGIQAPNGSLYIYTGISGYVLPGGFPTYTAAPAWVLAGASVDMSFSTNQYYGATLANGISVSRAQTVPSYAQTSTGTLTSFAADTPRITDQGLLVEEARTNLTLSSGDFTNVTYWTPTSVNITGGQADPAGGTAGVLFDEGTATSAHNIISAAGGNINYINATIYTASVYAKAGTKSIFQLTVSASAFSGVGYANFDLAAGTVAATGGSLVGSGIQNLGNGWYRCWITATSTATVSAGTLSSPIGILSTASTRAPSYTGTSSTLTFAFPQTEVGAFPTSYIPTTTVAVTRAADVVALAGAAKTVVEGTPLSLVTVTAAVPSNAVSPLIFSAGSNRSVEYNNFNTTNVGAWNGGQTLSANLGSGTVLNGSTKMGISGILGSPFGRSLVANNGTVATDVNSIGISNPTNLGSLLGTSRFLNSYFQRLTAWNSRLPDATLKAFTV